MKEEMIQTVDMLRDEIILLLQKMIQIPSVNPPGDYEEISDYLVEKLNEYGFKVEVIDAPESEIRRKNLHHKRRNVIATLKGSGGGSTLILNAHLDTVPEDNPSKWTYPPFSGMIKDGKIYGRGATDSKGRLAAYIGAALALKRSGIPLQGDIMIAATCDEETGGELGAGYLTNNKLLTGDFALVEGYSTEIIRAMAGMTQIRIVSHGQPAHSGFKWKGINAIEKMAKVITKLELLQKDLQEEPSSINGMKYTTINVGVIKGGTKLNVVPGSCEVEVDLRIIPEHTIDMIIKRIQMEVEQLQAEDPEMNIVIEKIGESETVPTITMENHPLVLALQNASNVVNGKELPVIGVMGQSDARWFIQNGIPAINYGPGTTSNRIHGYDECMEIEDLINTVKVISIFCANVTCLENKTFEGVANDASL